MRAATFLDGLGLARFAQKFEDEEILVLDDLKLLTEGDFKDLGLSLGARLKIARALRAMVDPSLLPRSNDEVRDHGARDAGGAAGSPIAPASAIARATVECAGESLCPICISASADCTVSCEAKHGFCRECALELFAYASEKDLALCCPSCCRPITASVQTIETPPVRPPPPEPLLVPAKPPRTRTHSHTPVVAPRRALSLDARSQPTVDELATQIVVAGNGAPAAVAAPLDARAASLDATAATLSLDATAPAWRPTEGECAASQLAQQAPTWVPASPLQPATDRAPARSPPPPQRAPPQTFALLGSRFLGRAVCALSSMQHYAVSAKPRRNEHVVAILRRDVAAFEVDNQNISLFYCDYQTPVLESDVLSFAVVPYGQGLRATSVSRVPPSASSPASPDIIYAPLVAAPARPFPLYLHGRIVGWLPAVSFPMRLPLAPPHSSFYY